MDGQPCGNLQGTFTSLTCTLPQNTDNTPILRAGSHDAVVEVKDHGFVLPQNGLAKIDVALTLTSLTPDTGTADGGHASVIAGAGFPLDKGDFTTFTLCGVSPTITSINNI